MKKDPDNWEVATMPTGWAFMTYRDGSNEFSVFRRTAADRWQIEYLGINRLFDAENAKEAKEKAIEMVRKELKQRLNAMPKI